MLADGTVVFVQGNDRSIACDLWIENYRFIFLQPKGKTIFYQIIYHNKKWVIKGCFRKIFQVVLPYSPIQLKNMAMERAGFSEHDWNGHASRQIKRIFSINASLASKREKVSAKISGSGRCLDLRVDDVESKIKGSIISTLSIDYISLFDWPVLKEYRELFVISFR